MPKFISHLYLIEALTNLHPGSGDANYATVDKTVQRDPATGYPTIHSSSLKGALREYFEEETDIGIDKVKYVFGDRPNSSDKEADQKGAYRFLPAHLLSLPLRSNYRPYYNAVSDGTLDTLEHLCKHLLTTEQNTFANDLKSLKIAGDGGESECYVLDTLSAPVSIEGYLAKEAQHLSAIPDKITRLLDDKIAIFKSEDLCQITKNQLPVIARNKLENGESKNLWYEEVLPRMTKFYFFIQVPEGDHHFRAFNDFLHNKVVQIGANASVGYGYCLIKKIV